MNRRNFIKTSSATTALAMSFPHILMANEPAFKVKFSPEFGIFEDIAGQDPIDQIKWGYDHGFRAWENTMLKSKPVALQEKISQTIQKLGMEFGQFVGTLTFTNATFAGKNADARNAVLKEVKESVEIAKRMNTKVIHNVLGLQEAKLPYDLQMANAVELLKRIADIYEPHGIVMVMESMNSKVDHPGMFLRTIPQAYSLAKSVDSPSMKILFDFYHVQIEEGHLLPTFDYVYDEIGYVQLGDTPGRVEPTAGEINYPKVIQHIWDKGYRSFLGLEHGSSKPGANGDLEVLKAYRAIDLK